jgi:predicted nucleic acid-binding protein
VIAWLAEADEDRVFLSVITLAELRHGIARLVESQRRTRLNSWLRDEITARFEGRLLPIDRSIADAWGEIVAQCDRAGRPIGTMDAFIAATARVHGLALVTRDQSGFVPAGIEMINPWSGER